MRLIQFTGRDGTRRVAVADDSAVLQVLTGTALVYDLALEAARTGTALATLAARRIGTERENYDEVVRERRLLPPLDHPDPYRCLVTGTGLSHLGSAAARDSMHAKLQQSEEALTDSMKMFKWGMDGGKPERRCDRHAAGMVLQGRWPLARGPGAVAGVAGVRARRRRGSRDRRTVCDRR